MAQRVFLHVGAPKTGTTYLQQILWGNRGALREAGFLLPGTRTAHYQAMGDLRRGLWYDPAGTWTWDRLASVAHEWDGTVVVSEEMLGAASKEEASSAIERMAPAEVHVVVAGRDLWRTIPSSWQQAVRARGTGRFNAYVEALRSGAYPHFWDHQTPPPILRRWCADLPVEQRHLVTVPPPGSEPELLWIRFAEALGIPDGVCRLDVGDGRGNRSLGAKETELLRHVNRALGDLYPLRAPYVEVVHGHLVNAVLAKRCGGERFGAPVELAEWAADKAREMVDELKAFPCNVIGDLDDLLPTDLGASRSPDEISDADLLDVAVETIVGMLRHAETLVSTVAPSAPATERKGTIRRFRRVAGQARRRLLAKRRC